MSLAPLDSKFGQKIKTDVKGVVIDRAFLAHFQVPAEKATAANTTGICSTIADVGAQQVISTGIANPSVPRNITATAGGTAADIKAIQVTIEGTNYANEAITETLPAFTADTAGTVVGSKAFRTVTKITVPAHDGTGATTAIGYGEKLGLPYKLSHNSILKSYLDNNLEGTAPVVATSAAAIENNTIDLNSALNSKAVDVYLLA